MSMFRRIYLRSFELYFLFVFRLVGFREFGALGVKVRYIDGLRMY